MAACGLMACTGAFAQDEEPKLVVKPSGRILMDAGVMHSTDETLNDQLNDGVAIPDVRMGVSATYGKWKAKVDVGYARQSLSLKASASTTISTKRTLFVWATLYISMASRAVHPQALRFRWRSL